MQSGQNDSAMNEIMPNSMRSSLMQTFNQKYGNQSRPDSKKEDKLKQWEKNLEKGDYVILGDKYDDGIVLPRKEFMNRQATGFYNAELIGMSTLVRNGADDGFVHKEMPIDTSGKLIQKFSQKDDGQYITDSTEEDIL